MKMLHKFEVWVGQIGLVYSGNQLAQAAETYEKYVSIVQQNAGRGESVVLMVNGEIHKEYLPETNSSESCI